VESCCANGKWVDLFSIPGRGRTVIYFYQIVSVWWLLKNMYYQLKITQKKSQVLYMPDPVCKSIEIGNGIYTPSVKE